MIGKRVPRHRVRRIGRDQLPLAEPDRRHLRLHESHEQLQPVIDLLERFPFLPPLNSRCAFRAATSACWMAICTISCGPAASPAAKMCGTFVCCVAIVAQPAVLRIHPRRLERAAPRCSASAPARTRSPPPRPGSLRPRVERPPVFLAAHFSTRVSVVPRKSRTPRAHKRIAGRHRHVSIHVPQHLLASLHDRHLAPQRRVIMRELERDRPRPQHRSPTSGCARYPAPRRYPGNRSPSARAHPPDFTVDPVAIRKLLARSRRLGFPRALRSCAHPRIFPTRAPVQTARTPVASAGNPQIPRPAGVSAR